jgi:hypothetical protein
MVEIVVAILAPDIRERYRNDYEQSSPVAQ